MILYFGAFPAFVLRIEPLRVSPLRASIGAKENCNAYEYGRNGRH
jgi:hypothetical protein